MVSDGQDLGKVSTQAAHFLNSRLTDLAKVHGKDSHGICPLSLALDLDSWIVGENDPDVPIASKIAAQALECRKNRITEFGRKVHDARDQSLDRELPLQVVGRAQAKEPSALFAARVFNGGFGLD